LEEQEIDLRPFILPLVARWKLIALGTLLLMLLLMSRVVLFPQPFNATADTLVKPRQSQPTFDPRFPNETADTASAAASSQNREKALTALAQSALLEDRVIPDLPPELLGENYEAGSLANRFRVNVEGELIRISAAHREENGARLLADTWARAYVNLVNEIYSGVVVEQVEEELQQAQQRYEVAQQELEDFILSNDLTALNRQIEILQTLLSHSRTSTLEQFSEYLRRARQKEDFLLDAQDLRRQLQADQTGNLGNIVAAMRVRARLGEGGSLPVQLQLDSLEPLEEDRISVADIDTMMEIAEQEKEELVQTHHQLARDATTGDVETIALPLELRDEYEQDLRELNMQVAQKNARQNLLTQNRDIALDTLNTLKRKLDEQRVSQGFTENQLVFIGTTVRPPDVMSEVVKNAAIGFALGLFLSIAGVITLDVIRPRVAALQQEAKTLYADEQSKA
jgi:uncharacterized protein involved in exopolysaccharide biosynthesis